MSALAGSRPAPDAMLGSGYAIALLAFVGAVLPLLVTAVLATLVRRC